MCISSHMEKYEFVFKTILRSIKYVKNWRCPKMRLPPVVIHKLLSDFPWNSFIQQLGYPHDYGNPHLLKHPRFTVLATLPECITGGRMRSLDALKCWNDKSIWVRVNWETWESRKTWALGFHGRKQGRLFETGAWKLLLWLAVFMMNPSNSFQYLPIINWIPKSRTLWMTEGQGSP